MPPPAPAPQTGNPIGWVAGRFIQCGYAECVTSVPAAGVNVRTGPGGQITGALVNGVRVIVVGQAGYWLAIQAQCPIVRTGVWSDTANVPLLMCAQ